MRSVLQTQSLSRKSPLRSMLSTSLIADFPRSLCGTVIQLLITCFYLCFQHVCWNQGNVVLYIFPSDIPQEIPFLKSIWFLQPSRQELDKYIEDSLNPCLKCLEFLFVWSLDLHGNLDVWRKDYQIKEASQNLSRIEAKSATVVTNLHKSFGVRLAT